LANKRADKLPCEAKKKKKKKVALTVGELHLKKVKSDHSTL